MKRYFRLFSSVSLIIITFYAFNGCTGNQILQTIERCTRNLDSAWICTCFDDSSAEYTEKDITWFFDSEKGDSINTGKTADSPLKSLKRISSIDFKPGDIIGLHRGSLWENEQLKILSNGTAEKPIVFAAYGTGEKPRIQNNKEDYEAIDIQGSYIHIIDIAVTGALKVPGILLRSQTTNNLLKRCEVTNTGIGISVSGTDHTIDMCYIHDLNIIRNTPVGGDDYGAIGIFFTFASRTTALRNHVENCIDESYDYGTDGGAFEIWRSCSDIEIASNYTCKNNCFIEYGGQPGDSIRNVIIHHNISCNDFAFCVPHFEEQFGMGFAGLCYEYNTVLVTEKSEKLSLFQMNNTTLVTASMLTVRNNIFYSVNNNRFYQLDPASTFIHEHNLYNVSASNIGRNFLFKPCSTEITGADPGFVNLIAKDFHLKSSSIAIGKGKKFSVENSRLRSGYTDFDGNPVQQAGKIDLGAYSYCK